MLVLIYISRLETEMRECVKRFEFKKAAWLRDTIKELRTKRFLFAGYFQQVIGNSRQR